MKKLSILFSTIPLLLLFLETGFAQTATFKDGVLVIPNTAVIKPDGVDYYSGVQLRTTGDGRFELLEAQEQNLVSIESVTVNIPESLPLQASVVIKGNKSLPCTKLLEPGIFVEGGNFKIALAESTLGPAETCIAIIDPFETSITLDVSDLAEGVYSVDVNGTSVEFTL